MRYLPLSIAVLAIEGTLWYMIINMKTVTTNADPIYLLSLVVLWFMQILIFVTLLHSVSDNKKEN